MCIPACVRAAGEGSEHMSTQVLNKHMSVCGGGGCRYFFTNDRSHSDNRAAGTWPGVALDGYTCVDQRQPCGRQVARDVRAAAWMHMYHMYVYVHVYMNGGRCMLCQL